MRTVLILIALGASTAAFAGEPSSSSGTAAKPNPDKIVCINEPNVGTRIPKRTCKTQAQWEEDRREAREMLINSTKTQTNPSGG